MFQRLKVPIIGVVQNMNTVVCPKCHHSLSLYGHRTEALTSELGNDNIFMFFLEHYSGYFFKVV